MKTNSKRKQNSCLFCDFYKSKNRIVLETEFFFTMYDAYPVNVGHSLVIPKKHRVSLFDLTNDEWLDIYSALKQMVKIIEKEDFARIYKKMIEDEASSKVTDYCSSMLEDRNLGKKPDGYNFGNNDGEAAGRTIHHLHIHIIPRYLGDVENSVGGIRNIIPNLGNYRK